MPDLFPIPEAIRLSNALDNLGSAAMAVEGANYNAELAIVTVIQACYSYLDPGLFAEVLEHVDDRTLATIIRAMSRFNKPASFVESVYAARLAR